ncbi:D-alanine--D-alanine ligase [Halomonas sp. DWK9]|uniref:D-alanine--D-alanine ligase n=1 Tax=Halomonas sp. DWK9 TaxID=3060155 RepID=UPI00287FDAF6|nr:D-alanine--D-alanine ligase [Halomonas sp. DWK9]
MDIFKSKVAVLMGGVSSEREVSLKSGNAILAALLRSGVNAFGIDLKENAIQDIISSDFDIAFIALHGRGGEDGCIQGVLEWLKKPYTGSDVMSSAIAMNKYKTKQIWNSLGLATPSSKLVTSYEDLNRAVKELSFPLMVKPLHEGSSIGISKVYDPEQLKAAFELADKFDKQIMVEEFVQGQEFTVAIVGENVFPVIGMETNNEFYDFDAKYKSLETVYKVPSGLNEEQESIIKKLAWEGYSSIDCSGWGRVDIMVDADKKPWLIEVNTCPGMTERSLVPQAAKYIGIDFDELVLKIANSALDFKA